MNSTRKESFDHGDSSCVGVLLTNLGTPDSYKSGDVRRYLKEFLWDPRVVEMPRPIWWLVLNLVILNTRPRKSAKIYESVWTDEGSPLLVISRQQRQKLEQQFNQNFIEPDLIKVELGMRYGNPSISTALTNLKSAGARKILILPLYPQYSATTTASTFDAVCAELSRWRWIPALRMINHYHNNPDYIQALANSVRNYRQTHGNSELLLMSFHGIPQAYYESGDPYYCECQETARLLAEELGLNDHEWKLSFQSRMGPKKWLQPYTDQTLISLAQKGTRYVQVICPGFSADCLETLEEIAVENRDVFLQSGGESFGYIPCLNDGNEHIRVLTRLVTGSIRDWLEQPDDTNRDAQKNRAMVKEST